MNVAESKERARSLVAKGRYEKAEVLYRQLLTRVPRDASVWVRHAETLKRLGTTHRAAWSYRTAATILVSLGYEARAIACLRLALECEPDDIDVISELIRVEMHRTSRHAKATHPAPPLPSRPVPLSSLEEPQLALPMLSAVDPRASGDSVVMHAPTWPQVRQISEREVAIKASAESRWVVISSATALEVHFKDDFVVADSVPSLS